MNRYLIDAAEQQADANRAERAEYLAGVGDYEPDPLPTMRDLIDLPEWQLQRLGYSDPFAVLDAPAAPEPF